jgi:DNA-directed RNA polymerase subunit RPC12/RpoP
VVSSTAGHDPGQLAGARTYRCTVCGFPITLLEGDDQPTCPRCASGSFRRASIFAGETVGDVPPLAEDDPSWVGELRAWLLGEGPHLAWESEEGIQVIPLREGFTRVGRSLRADIRLLDATVSRRHALIHNEAGVTTVLDDRSLNGVFVNGERADWRQLDDGDEVEVGSFRLHYIAPPGERS